MEETLKNTNIYGIMKQTYMYSFYSLPVVFLCNADVTEVRLNPGTMESSTFFSSCVLLLGEVVDSSTSTSTSKKGKSFSTNLPPRLFTGLDFFSQCFFLLTLFAVGTHNVDHSRHTKWNATSIVRHPPLLVIEHAHTKNNTRGRQHSRKCTRTQKLTYYDCKPTCECTVYELDKCNYISMTYLSFLCLFAIFFRLFAVFSPSLSWFCCHHGGVPVETSFRTRFCRDAGRRSSVVH